MHQSHIVDELGFPVGWPDFQKKRYLKCQTPSRKPSEIQPVYKLNMHSKRHCAHINL